MIEGAMNAAESKAKNPKSAKAARQRVLAENLGDGSGKGRFKDPAALKKSDAIFPKGTPEELTLGSGF